jgi:hypothetical protein
MDSEVQFALSGVTMAAQEGEGGSWHGVCLRSGPSEDRE